MEAPLLDQDGGEPQCEPQSNYVLSDDAVEIASRKASVFSGGSVKDFLKRSLPQGTMLSHAAVKDLEQKSPGALSFLQSWGGVLAQLLLFFVCVNMSALSNILVKFAKQVPGSTKPADPFFDGVVMAFANVVTLVAMIVTAAVCDGWDGFKACFDPKAIMVMSPPAIIYGVADTLTMMSLTYVDAAMAAVVLQAKLILSAIACRIFLKRHLLAVQWCALFVLTANLVVYIRVDALFDSKTGGGAAANSVAIGIALLIARVAVSVPAGVMSDVLFKTTKAPFYVQLAQNMWTSCLASLLFACVTMYREGLWDETRNPLGLFGGKNCGTDEHGNPMACTGWGARVIGLLFWYGLRTGVNCMLIKRMDVVWKGIADTVGTLFNYIYTIVLLGDFKGGWQAFELKTGLIFAIIVTVLGYVVAKMGPAPVAAPGGAGEKEKHIQTGGGVVAQKHK